VGLVILLLGHLGAGRLPGDLEFGGRHWKVFIPLGTCLLLSVGLSLLFWLLGHWRR